MFNATPRCDLRSFDRMLANAATSDSGVVARAYEELWNSGNIYEYFFKAEGSLYYQLCFVDEFTAYTKIMKFFASMPDNMAYALIAERERKINELLDHASVKTALGRDAFKARVKLEACLQTLAAPIFAAKPHLINACQSEFKRFHQLSFQSLIAGNGHRGRLKAAECWLFITEYIHTLTLDQFSVFLNNNKDCYPDLLQFFIRCLKQNKGAPEQLSLLFERISDFPPEASSFVSKEMLVKSIFDTYNIPFIEKCVEKFLSVINHSSDLKHHTAYLGVKNSTTQQPSSSSSMQSSARNTTATYTAHNAQHPSTTSGEADWRKEFELVLSNAARWGDYSAVERVYQKLWNSGNIYKYCFKGETSLYYLLQNDCADEPNYTRIKEFFASMPNSMARDLITRPENKINELFNKSSVKDALGITDNASTSQKHRAQRTFDACLKTLAAAIFAAKPDLINACQSEFERFHQNRFTSSDSKADPGRLTARESRPFITEYIHRLTPGQFSVFLDSNKDCYHDLFKLFIRCLQQDKGTLTQLSLLFEKISNFPLQAFELVSVETVVKSIFETNNEHFIKKCVETFPLVISRSSTLQNHSAYLSVRNSATQQPSSSSTQSSSARNTTAAYTDNNAQRSSTASREENWEKKVFDWEQKVFNREQKATNTESQNVIPDADDEVMNIIPDAYDEWWESGDMYEYCFKNDSTLYSEIYSRKADNAIYSKILRFFELMPNYMTNDLINRPEDQIDKLLGMSRIKTIFELNNNDPRKIESARNILRARLQSAAVAIFAAKPSFAKQSRFTDLCKIEFKPLKDATRGSGSSVTTDVTIDECWPFIIQYIHKFTQKQFSNFLTANEKNCKELIEFFIQCLEQGKGTDDQLVLFLDKIATFSDRSFDAEKKKQLVERVFLANKSSLTEKCVEKFLSVIADNTPGYQDHFLLNARGSAPQQPAPSSTQSLATINMSRTTTAPTDNNVQHYFSTVGSKEEFDSFGPLTPPDAIERAYFKLLNFGHIYEYCLSSTGSSLYSNYSKLHGVFATYGIKQIKYFFRWMPEVIACYLITKPNKVAELLLMTPAVRQALDITDVDNSSQMARAQSRLEVRLQVAIAAIFAAQPGLIDSLKDEFASLCQSKFRSEDAAVSDPDTAATIRECWPFIIEYIHKFTLEQFSNFLTANEKNCKELIEFFIQCLEQGKGTDDQLVLFLDKIATFSDRSFDAEKKRQLVKRVFLANKSSLTEKCAAEFSSVINAMPDLQAHPVYVNAIALRVSEQIRQDFLTRFTNVKMGQIPGAIFEELAKLFKAQKIYEEDVNDIISLFPAAESQESVESRTDRAIRLLNYAVKTGYLSMVKLLLMCHININPQYANDQQLQQACNEGWADITDMTDIVVALLEASYYDLSCQQNENKFAELIKSFAEAECTDIVNLLKEASQIVQLFLLVTNPSKLIYDPKIWQKMVILFNFNTIGEKSERLDISPLGRTVLNDSLKKCGYSIEMLDNSEQREAVLVEAVSLACSNGDIELVKALLCLGVDINAKNTAGYTPLLCAAQSGSVETVRALIDCGAKLDVTGSDGMSPLHKAASSGCLTVVQLLVAAKEKELAEQGLSSAEQLRRKEAFVNACIERTNITPVYCASQARQFTIKEYLISKGANDVDKKEHKDAMDIADEEHKKNSSILKSKNKKPKLRIRFDDGNCDSDSDKVTIFSRSNSNSNSNSNSLEESLKTLDSLCLQLIDLWISARTFGNLAEEERSSLSRWIQAQNLTPEEINKKCRQAVMTSDKAEIKNKYFKLQENFKSARAYTDREYEKLLEEGDFLSYCFSPNPEDNSLYKNFIKNMPADGSIIIRFFYHMPRSIAYELLFQVDYRVRQLSGTRLNSVASRSEYDREKEVILWLNVVGYAILYAQPHFLKEKSIASLRWKTRPEGEEQRKILYSFLSAYAHKLSKEELITFLLSQKNIGQSLHKFIDALPKSEAEFVNIAQPIVTKLANDSRCAVEIKGDLNENFKQIREAVNRTEQNLTAHASARTSYHENSNVISSDSANELDEDMQKAILLSVLPKDGGGGDSFFMSVAQFFNLTKCMASIDGKNYNDGMRTIYERTSNVLREMAIDEIRHHPIKYTIDDIDDIVIKDLVEIYSASGIWNVTPNANQAVTTALANALHTNISSSDNPTMKKEDCARVQYYFYRKSECIYQNLAAEHSLTSNRSGLFANNNDQDDIFDFEADVISDLEVSVFEKFKQLIEIAYPGQANTLLLDEVKSKLSSNRLHLINPNDIVGCTNTSSRFQELEKEIRQDVCKLEAKCHWVEASSQETNESDKGGCLEMILTCYPSLNQNSADIALQEFSDLNQDGRKEFVLQLGAKFAELCHTGNHDTLAVNKLKRVGRLLDELMCAVRFDYEAETNRCCYRPK